MLNAINALWRVANENVLFASGVHELFASGAHELFVPLVWVTS